MNKFLISMILVLSGCAGMKVIRPGEEQNKGTKALDWSTGTLVDTYSCSIVAGNGKRVVATEKSEEAARKEALLKCKDQTVISICRPENLKCNKN